MKAVSFHSWVSAMVGLVLGLGFSPAAYADELVAVHAGESRSGSSFWSAEIKTYRSFNGLEISLLEVTYSNDQSGKMCASTGFGGSPLPVTAVFVVGKGSSAVSYELPMQVNCQKWHTDDPADNRFPRAKLVLSSLSDRDLWDKIFPPDLNGNRWYALQLAAFLPSGWDSDFGKNYSIVLQKKN